MLKTLLKKQLMEIFRSYFYDPKKNKARSKGKTILFIVLFVLLMVVVLGGIFTGLSFVMCDVLVSADMGWLYFTIMGILAIFLGAFGSVFNTYSGLYLARDNDLLLSMPIPVRCVMASRLLGVYLMGLMYSAVVIVPAVIVYWCVAPLTLARVVGGIVLVVMISLIVLVLSCALGWVVAKISLKLKNKNFVTVMISLLFFGVYYFFCFRAQTLIQEFIQNAMLYGTRLKDSVYALYVFGRVGEGSWAAMLALVGVVLAALALTYWVMSRSFLKMATASGAVSKVRYRQTTVKAHSQGRALLMKEFARFTGSAAYMLNCGLGTLMLVAGGVAILLKGGEFLTLLDGILSARPGCVPVTLCAIMFMLVSMNDMSAPSISLEGKNLWLLQSLPVTPWQVLKAKLTLQLLLAGIPTLLCAVCAAAVTPGSWLIKGLMVLASLLYMVLMDLMGLVANLKMPNLTWTSEMVPIKQGGSVAVALLGGWVIAIAAGGLYLWQGWKLGATAYLALTALVLAAASAWLYAWLKTRGAKRFAAL